MLFYKLLGFLFLLLALLGVFLPLLPTTPFLLLAAACFAESSEKWHRWLMNNRYFGPVIKDWHDKRCISKNSKMIAILSVLLFGGCSIVFMMKGVYWQLAGMVFVSLGLFVVCRLKTCSSCR